MASEAAEPTDQTESNLVQSFVLAILASPAEAVLSSADVARLAGLATAQGASHVTLIAETEPDVCAMAGMTVRPLGGGREALVSSLKSLATDQNVPSDVDDVESALTAALEKAYGPAPDLVLVLGGEASLNGAYVWQAAYAEFVFVDKTCNDLDGASLAEALATFKARERRFGGLVSKATP